VGLLIKRINIYGHGSSVIGSVSIHCYVVLYMRSCDASPHNIKNEN